MDFGESRDAIGGRGEQDLEKEHSERAAQHTAAQAEEKAFGDGVSGEPRAAGAEGLPHGQFALAAGGAREQEAGDVHAREEQNGQNGQQQDPGGRTPVAVLPIAEGANAHMDFVAVGNGRSRDVALEHGLQRGNCLRRSPPGAEPGERT